MTAEHFQVATVLLAAGMSRRMGGRNKLLIEIGGVPLVRRTARAYLDAGTAVHAVLGFDAERVRAALADLPISFIVNPHYAEGQHSSVRAGVDSLARAYGTVLVALADQAALTPADIASLLQAFAASGRNRIMVPYLRGARGNPVDFRLPSLKRCARRAVMSHAAILSIIIHNLPSSMRPRTIIS